MQAVQAISARDRPMSIWKQLVDAFQDYEDEQREKDKIVPEDQRCWNEASDALKIAFNLDESLPLGTVSVSKDVWEMFEREAEYGRQSENYFVSERRRRRLHNGH